MTTSARISYVIMAVLLILIGWLHMATLVLTGLFGYFALNFLSFGRSKTLGVILYLILVAGLGSGLWFFSRHTYRTLPKIVDDTIPAVANYAERQGIELPFTDYASLKTAGLKEIKERVANVGRYAREAVLQIAMLIIGLVVAVSLFINARWDVEGDPHMVQGSLYSTVARELALRFATFYRSFATVIGAQIIISVVNTTLTAVFLIWNGFPYATVLIMLTFLLGLLPIIGNIMSNTLIVGVGFTISPKMALFALIFLIVIHKLEYFLNSKIIGDRIKNPMWLTLIGLVIGEKLMGIPGMILAPVVLHYIKVEASKNKLAETNVSTTTPSEKAAVS
ncbi:MAG TPA: AI-2E family transporter [Verrucomicrobiae bacterium]